MRTLQYISWRLVCTCYGYPAKNHDVEIPPASGLRGESFSEYGQCPSYGLVHVVILVVGQPTGESYMLSGLVHLSCVFLVEAIVTIEWDRVVRLVLPVDMCLRILSSNGRTRCLLASSVLELSYSGVLMGIREVDLSG